jgi:Mg-chelatase subunit ChlD
MKKVDACRLLVLVAFGCGAGPRISPASGDQGTSDGQAGGGAVDGAGGLAPQPPPSGGANGTADGAVQPSEIDCATATLKATPVPVDILIVQDKSGSMTDPATMGGMTKWAATRQALAAFLQSTDAAGLRVGLTFFPLDDAHMCSVPGYSQPVVPIGALPAAAGPILAALDATNPIGGTPTQPALDGAVAYAHQWEMTNNRRVAIALATDGNPNNCFSTVQSVSAAAAAAASTGIYTFVIGVGPLLQNLNAIALAGNTKAAYLVETGNPDDLVAAFKSIQQRAARLACSLEVPPAPAGQTLDPGRVNVRFSSTGDPKTGALLVQVPSRAQCGPMGGWYYDDPKAPTRITLCESSCHMANTTPEGQLSLVFGCKTQVIR